MSRLALEPLATPRECIPPFPHTVPSAHPIPAPPYSISASIGAAAAIGCLWLLRRSLPLSLACHRSPYHRRRRPSSAHSHSYPTPFPACLPPSPPLFSRLSVRVGGRPHTPQEATRSGCGRKGSRHRLCPGLAYLDEGFSLRCSSPNRGLRCWSSQALSRSRCVGSRSSRI